MNFTISSMLLNSKIRIAIGSLRKPKVDAVKSALKKIVALSGNVSPEIAFFPRDVDSNIARTPLSIDEMMLGAFNRAKNVQSLLVREGEDADYFLGMEGGLFQTTNSRFSKDFYLQSWVYAMNATQGFFGSSPAVQIPSKVTAEIRNKDFELADMMDRIGRIQNNRDKGGAFSLLTKGLLTRQAIFESAVLAAMAPFYHSELYA